MLIRGLTYHVITKLLQLAPEPPNNIVYSNSIDGTYHIQPNYRTPPNFEHEI